MPRLPHHLAALTLAITGLVGVVAGCATPADPAAGADSSPYPPPGLAAAAEVASTPAPSPTPDLPDLQLTCAAPFTGGALGGTLNSGFGYSIQAARPYTVRIDYGDGHTYQNDDKHLALVFSHTYRAPGDYLVVATVTDPDGHTAQGTCTNTWRLAPAAPITPSPVPPMPLLPYPWPVGSVGICNDGTVTYSAGVQGACSDHLGLSDTSSGDPGSSGGYGNAYGGDPGSTGGYGGTYGGDPGSSGGYGGTWVNGYSRADGTWVDGYWRN